MNVEFAALLSLAAIVLGGCVGLLWGRARNDGARVEAATARTELQGLRGQLGERQQQLERLQLVLDTARADADQSRQQLAALRAIQAQSDETAEQRRQDVARLQQETTQHFQLLSQRILEEKTATFTASNRLQMEQLLTPLGEKIRQFEQQVRQTYEYETRDRQNLLTQIRELQRLNEQVSADANNLATALKGDQRAQGVWGEMVLERVLERSGLRRGQEFDTQVSVSTEDGRARPDAIVYLPEGRHLIVDAKVSLTAYVDACNAADDHERAACLQRHLTSVRQHIADLSKRNYSDLPGFLSVDFVLMFLASEAAYIEALRIAPQLFEEAFERQVVLVSPSTLLPTLRAVANVWRLERQAQNAAEVFGLAGKIYDKFAGFLGDLETAQKALDKARDAYGEARDKLSTGRGNLIAQTQKLLDMGAKSSKALPASFNPRQETEPSTEVKLP